MDWLSEALSISPEQAPDTNRGLGTFAPISETAAKLIPILSEKLQFAAGLVSAVVLADLQNNDGSKTTALGFLDAPETAHSGLARVAQEALVFAGLEGHPLDVLFLGAESRQAKNMLNAGTEISLPTVQPPPKQTELEAPGSDPTKPPILR